MRKFRVLVILSGACGLAVASGAPAYATCGSTACFLSTLSQDASLSKKQLRFDLSYRYVDQSRKREGSSSTDEVLTPGVDFANGELEFDHHRELLTHFQVVQADLSYGLGSRLSLLATVPLLSARHHEHVVIEDGEEHFSDGDGTTGFGDVQVGARYALLPSARDLVLLAAWVKLPTGAHDELDTEGEITEPSLQPGTGSTDLIGSVYYSHQVQPRRMEAFAGVTYRGNGTNDLEYSMGNELQAALGVTRTLGKGWIASLQLNLRHSQRDRYLGEDVPSTGSTLLNITPGLRYPVSPSLALYAFLPLPVYQRVNEAQLTPKLGVVVGVSRTF